MIIIEKPTMSTDYTKYKKKKSYYKRFYQQNQYVLKYFSILIISAIIIFLPITHGIAQHINTHVKKTIVIDPGHGGNDYGAKGPAGTLEKIVTLKLAQMIETQTRNKYRTIFTRTGDYSVDLFERTAIANHVNADIFISIHTGGSFLHQVSGTTVFYFKRLFESLKSPEKSTQQNEWHNIQKDYQETSNIFGQMIKFRIDELITSKETKLQGSPVIVLEGAKMPAIVIEIGYITNPVDEKRLQETEYLSDLAKAITNGIEDFFNKSSSFQSMDLHK